MNTKRDFVVCAHFRTTLLAGAAAACLLAVGFAGAASAAVYDVTADFGGTMFQYGSGVAGTSFTAFSNHTACYTGLDCYNNVGEPIVVKNNNATAFNFSTLSIPAGTVDFHPGPAGSGDDAIIRFVAPTAGLYTISGFFARNDLTASGDGTLASVYATIGGLATSLFSTTLAANSYGSPTGFIGLTAALGIGDTVDFTLNNGSGYVFDSTGVGATLSVGTGVPEPATWALVTGGFGLMGAALRRRRWQAVAA